MNQTVKNLIRLGINITISSILFYQIFIITNIITFPTSLLITLPLIIIVSIFITSSIIQLMVIIEHYKISLSSFFKMIDDVLSKILLMLVGGYEDDC